MLTTFPTSAVKRCSLGIVVACTYNDQASDHQIPSPQQATGVQKVTGIPSVRSRLAHLKRYIDINSAQGLLAGSPLYTFFTSAATRAACCACPPPCTRPHKPHRTQQREQRHATATTCRQEHDAYDSVLQFGSALTLPTSPCIVPGYNDSTAGGNNCCT